MTTIRKSIRYGWEAETRLPLPEVGERHFLQLHTMKRYGGALVTTASVNERTADGLGYSHHYPGDYRTRVISDSVRCTEKAAAAQHAAALQQIEQIKAEALAHYAAMPA